MDHSAHASGASSVVLLFVPVELIGIPLSALVGRTFGFYYCILPMTQLDKEIIDLAM